MAMGAVTKVVLRLNASPWRGRAAGPIGFVHVPGAPFPTFWSATDGPRPLIVAWAGGPAADRLRGASELHLRAAATATLARAFGWTHQQFLPLLDGALVRVWADDPFARGAYSYVKVGHRTAGRTLAAPIAGTLFLAGEATDVEGWSGTVHGALETGARAARDLLAALGHR
jgi:monoamine oxidase